MVSNLVNSMLPAMVLTFVYYFVQGVLLFVGTVIVASVTIHLTSHPQKADTQPASRQAKAADEARLAAEATAAEDTRAAEEARLAAEATAEEEARLAEARLAEAAEEARLAAEATAEEDARAAEEARLAAEATAAEEARLAQLDADEAFARLLQSQLDEAAEILTRKECVVCLDASAGLRFTCGHLVCCIACSTSLRPSGTPSVVRCPVCRNPTHGQSSCLGAYCERCRQVPPSTGPQPSFEPPSTSTIADPSVAIADPSVGSVVADPHSQPEPGSWSEWAQRLVRVNQGSFLHGLHRIPVLAGLGVYDLEGSAWGYSSQFCAHVQEVRQAARLASTAPLWHTRSRDEQEAMALTVAGETYAVRGMQAINGRIDVWARSHSAEAIICRGRMCILVAVSNARSFDPDMKVMRGIVSEFANELVRMGF